MRTLNPLRFYRVLARRRRIADAAERRRRPATIWRPAVTPTVYVEAARAHALAALERQLGVPPALSLELPLAS